MNFNLRKPTMHEFPENLFWLKMMNGKFCCFNFSNPQENYKNQFAANIGKLFLLSINKQRAYFLYLNIFCCAEAIFVIPFDTFNSWHESWMPFFSIVSLLKLLSLEAQSVAELLTALFSRRMFSTLSWLSTWKTSRGSSLNESLLAWTRTYQRKNNFESPLGTMAW